MVWTSRLRHLYQRIYRRQRVDEELDAEVREYFETLIERGTARGLSRVFGMTAMLGRTFAEDEDQPGSEKVVVISHRSWHNLLGARRPVIGRDILLNGESYTIIGVLPDESPFDRQWADLWVPLVLPSDAPRNYHYLTAFARLEHGVPVQEARAEMQAIGLALGYGLLRWIQQLLPPFFLPSEVNVSMDGRVLLFLAAITIITSLACGVAPAIQAARGDAADAITEGGRTSSTGRRPVRARQTFIAAQVAVVFILLVTGGLLIRSLQRLMTVDVGFVSDGVMSASLPLPRDRDPNPGELTQYINRLLDAVRAVPGVQEAAMTTALPLRGWGNGVRFRLPDEFDRIRGTGFKIVTPGYFPALGLRLVEGRLLDEQDTAGSPSVVVVNQSFAERYSPDEPAVGKRILVERILPSRRGVGAEVSWEIIGVVADEKANGLERPSDVGVYASFAQNPVVGLGLVAKGHGNASALIKAVQHAVWNVNKHQALLRPMTVEQIKTEAAMPRRLMALLMAGFGALAMFLACAGIYGLLAFVTARRTQELGIRAALGATRRDLIRTVVTGGVRPVLVGIAIGLLATVPLSRVIQSILFETSSLDGPTLLGVSTLFLAVALTSCFIPAWWASRIDPMSALRQE